MLIFEISFANIFGRIWKDITKNGL